MADRYIIQSSDSSFFSSLHVFHNLKFVGDVTLTSYPPTKFVGDVTLTSYPPPSLLVM